MNSDDSNIKSLQTTGRMAGIWYFLMLVFGYVGLNYVPSKIIVIGDASATVQNIVNHELLFRFGILSNLLVQFSFIFLVLALSKLFKEVDKAGVKLMASFVFVSVPIAFLLELFQIAALLTLNETSNYLGAFEKNQLNSLTFLFLNIHEQGTYLVGFFWGLWLLPFGYLAYKSTFIPKILGLLLIIGGLAYVIDSCVALLFPRHKSVSEVLLLTAAVGEVAMIFWLLVKGVRSVGTLVHR
jgi:Domain of unknown function (DUF4386)